MVNLGLADLRHVTDWLLEVDGRLELYDACRARLPVREYHPALQHPAWWRVNVPWRRRDHLRRSACAAEFVAPDYLCSTV